MKRIVLVLMAVGLLGAVGCGQDQPGSSGSIPTVAGGSSLDPAGMMDMCPMHVTGTTVSVADAGTGVAIRFITTGGDETALRDRVQHMADMHNAMCPGGSMNRRDHGMNGAHDRGLIGRGDRGHMGEIRSPMARQKHVERGDMMMVPATATVQEIEGGAEIVFTPRQPSQLRVLALHLRSFVERMQNGECPMAMMTQNGMHGTGHANCGMAGTGHAACDSTDPGTGGGTGEDDGHEGHH